MMLESVDTKQREKFLHSENEGKKLYLLNILEKIKSINDVSIMIEDKEIEYFSKMLKTLIEEKTMFSIYEYD